MFKIFMILNLTLIVISTSVYSQVKDLVYFKQDFTASVTPTEFKKVLTTQNKESIIQEEFEFNGKSWQKTDRSKYRLESGSTYINKSTVFNRISLVDHQSTIYKVVLSKTEDGNFLFREYNFYKQLLREGTCKSYFPLIKHGEVKEYYTNGELNNISMYDNNRFVSSQRWMISGKESLNNVYTEVEKLPRFEGKSEDLFYAKLRINIHFPVNPKRKERLNGRCALQFIVQKDGSIADLQFIENSNFPEIDFQVYDFVRKSKHKWSAAEVNGKKVDCVQQIALSFKRNIAAGPIPFHQL